MMRTGICQAVAQEQEVLAFVRQFRATSATVEDSARMQPPGQFQLVAKPSHTFLGGTVRIPAAAQVRPLTS